MKQIFEIFKTALSRIQWRQFAVACSAIVILLTANGADAQLIAKNPAQTGQLPPTENVGRPRTMGQWEAENEALEGQPVKKLERIAEESADAVKNWAEIYPQNARTLTPGLDNGELPNDDK